MNSKENSQEYFGFESEERWIDWVNSGFEGYEKDVKYVQKTKRSSVKTSLNTAPIINNNVVVKSTPDAISVQESNPKAEETIVPATEVHQPTAIRSTANLQKVTRAAIPLVDTNNGKEKVNAQINKPSQVEEKDKEEGLELVAEDRSNDLSIKSQPVIIEQDYRQETNVATYSRNIRDYKREKEPKVVSFAQAMEKQRRGRVRFWGKSKVASIALAAGVTLTSLFGGHAAPSASAAPISQPATERYAFHLDWLERDSDLKIPASNVTQRTWLGADHLRINGVDSISSTKGEAEAQLARTLLQEDVFDPSPGTGHFERFLDKYGLDPADPQRVINAEAKERNDAKVRAYTLALKHLNRDTALIRRPGEPFKVIVNENLIYHYQDQDNCSHVWPPEKRCTVAKLNNIKVFADPAGFFNALDRIWDRPDFPGNKATTSTASGNPASREIPRVELDPPAAEAETTSESRLAAQRSHQELFYPEAVNWELTQDPVEFETEKSKTVIYNYSEASIDPKKTQELVKYFEDKAHQGKEGEHEIKSATLPFKVEPEKGSNRVFFIVRNDAQFPPKYEQGYKGATRFWPEFDTQVSIIKVDLEDLLHSQPNININRSTLNDANTILATEVCQSTSSVRSNSGISSGVMQEVNCNSEGWGYRIAQLGYPFYQPPYNLYRNTMLAPTTEFELPMYNLSGIKPIVLSEQEFGYITRTGPLLTVQ
jgi:hypothetical protein